MGIINIESSHILSKKRGAPQKNKSDFRILVFFFFQQYKNYTFVAEQKIKLVRYKNEPIFKAKFTHILK